jgi:trehalose-6-phosphate synthase
MNTVLDYLAIDIITMYENNIKQHFVEYVERFVNVSWKEGTDRNHQEAQEDHLASPNGN